MYYAKSLDIVLICCLLADVFHFDKLILLGIDVFIKFMPIYDNFLFMCGDGDNLGFKMVIDDKNLIVFTKHLFDTTKFGDSTLFVDINMRLPYTCLMLKHVAIPPNSVTICLDNIFTGALLDSMVMSFVTDTAFARSYTKNPFNFINFTIKQMDLFLNSVRVPTSCYFLSFSKNLCNKAYFTFQEQLGFDQGGRCANISPENWANNYNFYSFKLTKKLIGSCM